MSNIIELAIEFTINKAFEVGLIKAEPFFSSRELKMQILEYSETFFKNTYEHLSIEEEFDFCELNNFLCQKINKDSLLRFSSLPYSQRQLAIKRFIEDAYKMACANTKKQEKIVSAYLTVILEIIEHFFLYENKIPEAVLANRSVDELAVLVENMKEVILNNINHLSSKDTFSNYIELLEPPVKSKNPFHYLNESMGFYGREKEVYALEQFINDERQVLFAVIVGNGGIGKSKLMKEFIKLHRHDLNWKMILCNHPMAKNIRI